MRPELNSLLYVPCLAYTALFFTRCSEDDSASPVFQKFNPLLHGGAAAEAAEGRGGAAAAASGMKVELLTLEFIQKYLQQAKKKTPRLTETARAAIVEAYNGEIVYSWSCMNACDCMRQSWSYATR